MKNKAARFQLVLVLVFSRVQRSITQLNSTVDSASPLFKPIHLHISQLKEAHSSKSKYCTNAL